MQETNFKNKYNFETNKKTIITTSQKYLLNETIVEIYLNCWEKLGEKENRKEYSWIKKCFVISTQKI